MIHVSEAKVQQGARLQSLERSAAYSSSCHHEGVVPKGRPNVKKQSISFLLAAALVVPGLALAGAAGAAAQDAPAQVAPGGDAAGQRGPRGRSHRGRRGIEARMQRLTARLGLDANQQALVRRVFEQARSEHQALRAARGAEGPSPERREARRALRQRTMERVDAVLTPEQRATLEQMRATFRARHEGRRGRPCGGGGADAVDPRGI